MSKLEPYIGDPGDEHQDVPARTLIDWYRDEEGYLWPVPAEGRVKVEDDQA